MIKLLCLFFVTLIICSCGNDQYFYLEKRSIEFEKLNWLLGSWQQISDEGVLNESWEKKNDTLFEGKSYFLKNADTVFRETIILKKENHEVVYIPKVKNQNGGLPVKFTLTYFTENKFVFENPAHDFPQQIIYTYISKDSLIAEISGFVNGKRNSQTFPMKRLKHNF